MQTRERWAPGAVRTVLGGVGVVGLSGVLALGSAGPAAAHGAPIEPVSRAAACGQDGRHRTTPACAAAIAASGGRIAWDNLRVAGVDGRDREVIPDGKLCSAGLRGFAGLDAPRADWPTTVLTPGAPFTLTYRTTIPHRGTFRLYLTHAGYDPRQPLRWADLDSRPFLTATDPPVVEGAYVLRGRLPQGRTGQQLIYTIWQNSSTADTYYSCSDVVFPAPAGITTPTPVATQPPGDPTPAPSATPTPAAMPTPAAGTPTPVDGSTPATGPAVDGAATGGPALDGGGPPIGSGTVAGAVGAAGLTGLGGVAVLFRRRRNSRGR